MRRSSNWYPRSCWVDRAHSAQVIIFGESDLRKRWRTEWFRPFDAKDQTRFTKEDHKHAKIGTYFRRQRRDVSARHKEHLNCSSDFMFNATYFTVVLQLRSWILYVLVLWKCVAELIFTLVFHQPSEWDIWRIFTRWRKVWWKIWRNEGNGWCEVKGFGADYGTSVRSYSMMRTMWTWLWVRVRNVQVVESNFWTSLYVSVRLCSSVEYSYKCSDSNTPPKQVRRRSCLPVSWWIQTLRKRKRRRKSRGDSYSYIEFSSSIPVRIVEHELKSSHSQEDHSNTNTKFDCDVNSNTKTRTPNRYLCTAPTAGAEESTSERLRIMSDMMKDIDKRNTWNVGKHSFHPLPRRRRRRHVRGFTSLTETSS